ncbi:MAG: DUF1501 domain-containing protein [Burkholderiaceae bacterium]|nr:DUF1501 domain-containing protein [Burkholderiaceae bacterium]
MSHPISNASRRAFLRRAGVFSATGVAAPLAVNLAGIGRAAAQSASDYKALVCIFLYGGNDAYNTVLATDTASWNHYLAVRDTIALRAPGTPPLMSAGAGSPERLGGVLAINPARAQPGRSFALHPVMTGARDLFEAKRLAVVANVGPLLRPTTKAQYQDDKFAKPPKLFSHNDQTSTWQAGAPEGAIAGWGGRAADLLAASNSRPVFTSISATGNAVWLSGNTVLQYQVSSRGAIRVGSWGNTLYGSTEALTRMQNVMRRARSSHWLEQDHAGVAGRSIDAEASLSAALPGNDVAPYGTPGMSGGQDPLLQYDNPLSGGKSTNSLAQQLQIVARIIGARGALGTHRQVFFVSMGGFDTHSDQGRSQADNMAKLSHGLKYFNDTLGAMGVANGVTTFTASDFGRTFTSNGDGTDHGWGAHHFVMGGAVRGGDLYGNFPAYSQADVKGNFSSPNQIGNGTMLPEVSVDQYAATMARWFGVPDAQLPDLFPNLVNFDAGVRDLGFMA